MKIPKTIKELKSFLMRFGAKTEIHMHVNEQADKVVYALAFEVEKKRGKNG